MPLLRDGFQPTDFADADCRVGSWWHHDFHGLYSACRVWVCKCGKGYWFQRHEWVKVGANETSMDDWIFAGYSPDRAWPAHMVPAPEMSLRGDTTT
jgi:hypothetical protein